MTSRPHPPAANDNLGPIALTERTMMGFGASLIILIAIMAHIVFGGVA